MTAHTSSVLGPGTFRARARRSYRQHERAFLGTLSFGGLFVLWELAARTRLIPEFFFGSPSGVVLAAVAETQTEHFWMDARVSLVEFLSGYLLALVCGVVLGILLGWYRRLGYLFEPVMNFFYATPRVALLPLIVLALGLTIWSKIAVVFLGAFVTILLNTYHGVHRVDPSFVAVARSFSASDRMLFTSVVVPGSVPFILAGLRLGVGRALIGVVVAELYAAGAGLGFMITVASRNLEVNKVLFATFILIAFGFASVEALRRAELRFANWRQSARMGP